MSGQRAGAGPPSAGESSGLAQQRLGADTPGRQRPLAGLEGDQAVADLLAAPRIGFLPLLSLGPALAAISYRPSRTALTGGLALGLCVLLALYDGRLDCRPGTVALATVFGVTAAGLLASAGRQRRERALANVRAVAEVAQRVLLRPVPRDGYPPVQVAVRYLSANVSARIGGGLYEVIARPGVLRLIVGDVQGKQVRHQPQPEQIGWTAKLSTLASEAMASPTIARGYHAG